MKSFIYFYVKTDQEQEALIVSNGESVIGNIAVAENVALYCNKEGHLVQYDFMDQAQSQEELGVCAEPGLVASTDINTYAYTDTRTTIKVMFEGQEYKLGGSDKSIIGLHMNNKGNRIAVVYDAPESTGPSSGEFFVFTLGEGDPQRLEYPITGEVMDVAFSPSDDYLAASDPITEGGEPFFGERSALYGWDIFYPGNSRLWTTQAGVLNVWGQQALGIEFSLDESLLFLGNPRGEIIVIALDSGEIVVELPSVHGLGIIDLLLSEDGSTLFVLSSDGSVSKMGIARD